MDFEPKKNRIEDLLDSSVRMVIPRYQRTFTWSKDNILEFYDDFLRESSDPEENLAFMGTLLFSTEESGVLEVIDGQQRLVTITIFFAAARDVLKNIIRTSDALLAAEAVQTKIKRKASFGSSYGDPSVSVKLTVGVEIEDIFSKIIYETPEVLSNISPKKRPEKMVKETYTIFYNNLKELVDRPGINSNNKLEIINNQLKRINTIEYIDIRVNNKEVAFNLFESHNAKGVALAKTDLIKNYYFSRLKGSENEKNKQMDYWDELFERLDEQTSNMLPDRFFSYMLQSRIGNFSSSILYKKIKPVMQNPQSFFNKLSADINSMIALKTASTENKKLDRSLNSIEKIMKVNQCFIFMLALHRNKNKLSAHYLEQIIKLIENFTYLYSAVTKSPTNALEKIYSSFSQRLEKDMETIHDKEINNNDRQRIAGQLLESLRKEFREMIPTYQVFFEEFSSLNYENLRDRALIRYTFNRIESHHSNGMVELGDQFTLDHIISQKVTKGKGELYQSIGNLVALSGKDNSSKGANDPLDFIDTYKKFDNFYSTKLLVNYLEVHKKFNEEEIVQRIHGLADFAYNEVFNLSN